MRSTSETARRNSKGKGHFTRFSQGDQRHAGLGKSLTITQGHRVVTLIDGDGTIFSRDFISQGLQGGHLAARLLSDSITQFLSTNYGAKPYQLWVYLFYNRRGLTDTFNRVGLGSLNKTFEDFVVGFNQATERFTMVDVGSTKEAADVKLKGSHNFVTSLFDQVVSCSASRRRHTTTSNL
jgi:hypothetical protein